LHVQAVY